MSDIDLRHLRGFLRDTYQHISYKTICDIADEVYKRSRQTRGRIIKLHFRNLPKQRILQVDMDFEDCLQNLRFYQITEP